MKIQKFPGGARLRTPLDACAFGPRLGNRSVFILDPRLKTYYLSDANHQTDNPSENGHFCYNECRAPAPLGVCVSAFALSQRLFLNCLLTVTEKKLTDSRKRAKILADNRKSDHPIETLSDGHARRLA